MLSAHAGDQNAGDKLTYSISAGNEGGFFRIDPRSGQLSVSRDGADHVQRPGHADVVS